MEESLLIKSLRKMKPANAGSFEELVAKLLTELTGKHFYCARSGDQRGRDASSDSLFNTIIAVECKRFGNTTELDETHLLGKLASAVKDIKDLDLWVLVTSRSVNSQLYEALQFEAQSKGVGVEIISAQADTPSQLEVLCSQSLEITLHYLETSISPEDKEVCRSLLLAIQNHPDYIRRLNELQAALSPASIGYANWHKIQSNWMLECFSSEATSRAAFGQKIDIKGKDTFLVERPEVWATLDQWIAAWPNKQTFCILSGEEGDGKTWATASWALRKIQENEEFPPVLFVNSSDPISNDPEELISQDIEKKIKHSSLNQMIRDEDYWQKRLFRWLQRPESKTPLLLLILDGINQHREPSWWRGLLEKLSTDTWVKQVAVLITVRNSYWKQHFKDLPHFSEIFCYELQPYSDNELRKALSQHNLNFSDIPSDLFTLIRKPRYFDLVVKHRNLVALQGDPTKARLIYEDWRHRLSKRNELPISDDEFQETLKSFAQKYQKSILNRFTLTEISEAFPKYTKENRCLDELMTGGVISRAAGKYVVEENRLVLGLGLILADQAEDASSKESKLTSIEEIIAEWLEPHREMDVKAAICEAAALHVLTLKDEYSLLTRLALLIAWMESQNPSKDTEHYFTAYMPSDPKAYVGLAEIIWSDQRDNAWLQELVMLNFLRWHDNITVVLILEKAFKKWLGFIHLQGFRAQRHNSDQSDSSIQNEIQQRIGCPLNSNNFKFANFTFTIIEDAGLLRLGRVALSVISHLPREEHIHAIILGCVAEAIMGHPDKYNLFAWVIRSSPTDLWPRIKSEFKGLLLENNVVINQAIYRLCNFIGTVEALHVRQNLPDDLFPPNPIHELIRKNPCTNLLYMWRRQDCRECLERRDLDIIFVATRLRPFCIKPSFEVPQHIKQKLSFIGTKDNGSEFWQRLEASSGDTRLEEIEPALSAYDPKTLANLICRIVADVVNREGVSLRQLALRLEQHHIILGESECQLIFSAWEKLVVSPDIWSKNHKETEYCLLNSFIAKLDPIEQLSCLLRRPQQAADWDNLDNKFKAITNENDWQFVNEQLTIKDDDSKLSSVLWFLSAKPTVIPEKTLEIIYFLTSHDTAVIRFLSLEILYKSQNKGLAKKFATNNWTWCSTNHSGEYLWASLLLIDYGDIDFTELTNRIHPLYLGYAVDKYSEKENFLNWYAELIHGCWLKVCDSLDDISKDLPACEMFCHVDPITSNVVGRYNLSSQFNTPGFSLINPDSVWGGTLGNYRPGSFSPSELLNPLSDEQRHNLLKVMGDMIDKQIESGNYWFNHCLSSHVINQILIMRPDLKDQWINVVLERQPEGEKALFFCRGFYETLCEVMLRQETSLGLRLYQCLLESECSMKYVDDNTKIPLLDYALFRAPQTLESEHEWLRKLDECLTDIDIFELVIAAEAGSGIGWLHSKIETDIQSQVLFYKARAIVMLGFSCFVDAEKIFRSQFKEEPESWLDEIVEKSFRRYQLKLWAQHWFQNFLTAQTDVSSWAAFRLFLQCVDRRFWHWKGEFDIIASSKLKDNSRLIFFQDNENTIKNSIKKNEKELREHLFYQKILKRQSWPWQSFYS